MTRPLMSFVLSSRNDRYEGDSVWRLHTAIEYLAERVDALGRRADVEVVICDWGSSVPLRKELSLSASAADLCRFAEVSPATARVAQGDSPFPEVIANNTAIRRAHGRFIGRIDQDTIVGSRFLAGLLDLLDGRRPVPFDPERVYMFHGRRSIPLSFARRCPSLAETRQFIRTFGDWLPLEGRARRPWYDACAGIEVMSAERWHEARGYDERLVFWGYMGTDLAQRIERRYSLVNLEKFVPRDLYHLRHGRHRLQITPRRKNPRRAPASFAMNAEDWGLPSRSPDTFTALPRAQQPTTEEDENFRMSSLRCAAAVAWEAAVEIGLRAPRYVRHAIPHRGD